MDLVILQRPIGLGHLDVDGQNNDLRLVDMFVVLLMTAALATSRRPCTALLSSARRPPARRRTARRVAGSAASPAPSPQTAVLWLSPNRLRLRDNRALTEAARRGPDGLDICATWPGGATAADAMTPSRAFGRAAVRSLGRSLATRGQTLHVLSAGRGSHGEIAQVASLVRRVAPASVVVDTSLVERHLNLASRLREALRDNAGGGHEGREATVLEVFDDGLLFPADEIPGALGRSRKGGRALRWTTFLNNALEMRGDESLDKPTWSCPALPPPAAPVRIAGSVSGEGGASGPTTCVAADEILPRWADQLLAEWGEASEEEALRRAAAVSDASSAATGEVKSPLSERGSRDTRLSPYLQYGLISPQRAARLGVRRRDLHWRDWSHACYSLVGPLRRGEAVLTHMDRACSSRDPAKEIGDDAAAAFRRWCVGNTGAPLVDAGMRQLWSTGWLPRQVRLLSAACLTEGLGVEWQRGRDWFEHTLVDHDAAINEVMWQNAGLCGLDPFYAGLWWERPPSGAEEEGYVDRWRATELAWPSRLRPYVEDDARRDVAAVVAARRRTLRERSVYRATKTVVNAGVRVAWPGLSNAAGIESGEILGVGTVSVDHLHEPSQ